MFTTALLSLLGLVGLSSVSPAHAAAMANPFAWSTECEIRNSPLEVSCHNTTVQDNTCCFESPGGLLMQVQLWDVNPSDGPTDKWTIHGLWPDYCNGTWGQFCDPSRYYPNVTQTLIDNNANDLLAFMSKFWLNQGAPNEAFWEHEWNKHGTCMSTLLPACMPYGAPTGYDATRFFHQTVELYKGLPTYDILAAAGIHPSATKSYTYAELAAAVKREIGVTPAFDCDNSTIYEIDYYHNLRGSIVDGKFERIDAYAVGSCPQTGPLWYLPKNKTTTASK